MVDHARSIAPGRLRVLDLTRFTSPGTGGQGRWACTRCGEEHPTVDSWSLLFDTVRGPRSMVLCRSCAEEYRPSEAGAPAQ